MTEDQIRETIQCDRKPAHFIRHHCRIEDPQIGGEWFPFDLWPAQEEVLETILDNQKVAVLKARQLGLSWLVLALVLWYMLFRPGSSIAITSRRDTEAVYLLKDRLKGMYARLPAWMKSPIVVANDHEFRLANGSVARAFPTSTGDSYTNTIVIIDEADLVSDLAAGLRAMKPTIDAGGKLILISKVFKATPNSEFKKIFRSGESGSSSWKSVFLPWHVRPTRTPEWYEQEKLECLATTGSLDDLYENYPSTSAEALAPKALNKRYSNEWVLQCFDALPAVADAAVLARVREINASRAEEDAIDLSMLGLVIYRMPEKGLDYIIGADPAEGNPNSDDSALTVLRADTWEEVASLAGRYEPELFARHINAIGIFFNEAAVLCERNNHGHAVLMWLNEHGDLDLIYGEDRRPGWATTAKSKTLMFSTFATALRERDVLFHRAETSTQLASIEASTLKAPEGDKDDLAISIILALQAVKRSGDGFI